MHQERKSFAQSLHMLRFLISMFSNEFDYEPTLINLRSTINVIWR